MKHVTPQKLYAGWQLPVQWLNRAERLAEAVETLLRVERDVDVRYRQAWADAMDKLNSAPESIETLIEAQRPNYGAAQLLYGFAIENALKGLCVAAGSSLANPDKLDKRLRQHDLRKLAALAGVTLSPGEGGFLDRLTRFIEWGGRYPVGVNRDTHEEASDLWSSADRMLGDWSDAHRALRETYTRLEERLMALTPDRMKGDVVVRI